MTEYCRLCAELKYPSEIVSSIDDVEQSMEQKLRACCQWTAENTERQLPHSVCSICLDKLEKCWLFAQSVQLAQQRLLEIFVKIENDTEPEPYIEMVEIETKPGQIDNDCLDDSNSFPSPHNDFNATPARKDNTLVSNSIEPNEMVKSEFDGTLHKCPVCGKFIQRRWNFTEHMRTHSDERPFECPLCHKKFKTKQSLRVHCKNQPENKCEICLREFCSTTELNTHIQATSCKPPSIGQTNLNAHFNVDSVKQSPNVIAEHFSRNEHKQQIVTAFKLSTEIDQVNANELKHKCPECGKRFKFQSTMLQHMPVHTKGQPFECWQCHKRTKSIKNLKLHMKIHQLYRRNSYPDESLPKCDSCGETFKNWHSLNTHCRSSHTNCRFNCKQCDKTFRLKQSLERHLERHAGISKGTCCCELCGKVFIHVSFLEDHMAVHSDQRPYKCDICGMGYKTKRSLNSHHIIHTEIQHKCTQCKKSFRKKASLKIHMESHTGTINKPIVCDVCGKAFRKNGELLEHRRIHTGERPFNCEHCPSNFRYMSSFYDHLRKKHGISMSARNREQQARATAMSSSITVTIDETPNFNH